MVARARAFDIDPGALPLTHLAFFVGTFANRKLAAEMQRAGYADLRESYGYLFQHLLGGPCSVGELSRRLGVTQQAVSKTVAELTAKGLAYDNRHAPNSDSRGHDTPGTAGSQSRRGATLAGFPIWVVEP